MKGTMKRGTQLSPAGRKRVALVDRLDRQDADRERAAAAARQAAAETDAATARKFRDVCMAVAGQRNLSMLDAERLANHVENKRRAAQKSGERFDALDTINAKLVDFGHGVDVPRNANPLAPAYPLASTPGTEANPRLLSPNEASARHAAHEAERERAARFREEQRVSKERYQAALKRLGLSDPAHGWPSDVNGNPRI